MPKIDIAKIPDDSSTAYPAPFRKAVAGRVRQRLGNAAGLTQFGVNLARLRPGAASSQRHWHEAEDEFVYVLEGELVLVTDAGEEIMRAGDGAGFKAGDRDGHHLQNRSDKPARFLVVGSRHEEDWGEYPDVDMKFLPGRGGYTRKTGEPL